MGLTEVDVKRKLSGAFNEEQATVLVTHYARPAMLPRAEEAGVIVVQSFGW